MAGTQCVVLAFGTRLHQMLSVFQCFRKLVGGKEEFSDVLLGRKRSERSNKRKSSITLCPVL
jgi:hypothetical protein